MTGLEKLKRILDSAEEAVHARNFDKAKELLDTYHSNAGEYVEERVDGILEPCEVDHVSEFEDQADRMRSDLRADLFPYNDRAEEISRQIPQ